MKKRRIITPYERLRIMCNEAWNKLAWPKQKEMGLCVLTSDFPPSIYQRIKAAEELGYEVLIRATDRGVEFTYREKISDRDKPYLLYN